jgi:hypothetical protein
MRWFTALVVGFALLCTAAAAAHAPMPQADYIDRADEICHRFNPHFETRIKHLQNANDRHEYVRAVNELKELSKDQYEQLQRLHDPQTGLADLNRYFTRYRRALQRLADVADVARTGNVHATNAAIDRFVKASHAQYKAAQKFGFTFCV